jgi:hypothetical protein
VDRGAADYRALYFGERASIIVVHEFYRVAQAHVGAVNTKAVAYQGWSGLEPESR